MTKEVEIEILKPNLCLLSCLGTHWWLGFKTAAVTPLIKKTTLPADDLKNYHPVSGLSSISKLV